MVDIFFSYCWCINVLSVILLCFCRRASHGPFGAGVECSDAIVVCRGVWREGLVVFLTVYQVAGSRVGFWACHLEGVKPRALCRGWGKGTEVECRSLAYFGGSKYLLAFLYIHLAKFWGLSLNWLSREHSWGPEISCRLYRMSLFFFCLFLLHCFMCQVHLQMEHRVAVF